LSNFRCKIDDREELTTGFKFNEWELRGVPLRIEIGPKDIKTGSVITARRDMTGKEGKSSVTWSQLEKEVETLLTSIQANLLAKATEFRDSHIYEPKTYKELKDVINKGWALCPWC